MNVKKGKVNTMKTVTTRVWIATTNAGRMLFLSRGKAIDNDKNGHPFYTDLRLLEEQELPRDKHTLYNVRCMKEGEQPVWSPYFLTEKDAMQWAADNYSGWSPTPYAATLYPQHYEKPKGPHKVQMLWDEEKQRYFCFINLNPDADGMYAAGKRCFPDRAWTHVSEGTATVNIACEKETYGFVKGRMMDFTYIDFQSILDYVWEHKNSETQIGYVENSAHGTYYTAKDRWGDRCRFVFDSANGGACLKAFPCELDAQDAEKHLKWELSAANLCFSEAWNLDPKATPADEVTALFAPCPWQERYLPNLHWQVSVATSEALCRGTETGVLQIEELCEFPTKCAIFIPSNLMYMSKYTRNEVEETLMAATALNEECDTYIKNKMRKGLIKPAGIR